ncbi:MAG: hypothetical protein L0Z49_12385 [Actinobacteria bacterium]|nr:hypothetical protein [Actinomycetota bacterium]
MTLAFDAATSLGSGTGDLSADHTPVGTPRGVFVFVVQDVGTTDEVDTITYGSLTLTEVALSPHLTTTGDDGGVYCWFAGASIPTGAQTVTVDVNATGSAKGAAVITVTAGADTEVHDTTTLDSASVTDPSVTLTTTTATYSAAAIHGGGAAVGNLSAATGNTDVVEFDFGSSIGSIIRADAEDAGSDYTIGWTTGVGGAQSAQALGCAIAEVSAAAVSMSVGHINIGF